MVFFKPCHTYILRLKYGQNHITGSITCNVSLQRLQTALTWKFFTTFKRSLHLLRVLIFIGTYLRMKIFRANLNFFFVKSQEAIIWNKPFNFPCLHLLCPRKCYSMILVIWREKIVAYVKLYMTSKFTATIFSCHISQTYIVVIKLAGVLITCKLLKHDTNSVKARHFSKPFNDRQKKLQQFLYLLFLFA